MNYSMTRFGPRDLEEKKSLLELIQDTAKTVIVASSLADMVAQRQKKRASDDRARRAVRTVIDLLEAAEVEEAEATSESLLFKVLGKIVRFVGRKLFEYVVRPIFNFAARMAMAVVRFALNTLVRFVIVPIIEVVTAFVIANPITATVFLAAAAAGGAYWLWNQFFKGEAKIPGQPTVVPGAEVIPQVAGAPEVAPARTVLSYIEAPVAYVKETYAKATGKGRKFAGFGADVDSYIKEASALYGIPEDILRGFVKMEAGWTGQMSPTGAIGTGQFIQSTWDMLARTAEGQAIGMTVIGSRFRTEQDPRFDKRINTLATALLAKKNAELLRARGIPVTGENLYMMHNIGPGILSVMQGLPASPATLLAMKQNGMLVGQTPEQFLVWQKGRFAAQYQAANTSTSIAGDKVAMADGVSIPKPQVTTVAAPQDASNKNSPQGNKLDRTIVRGKGKTLMELQNV